uniref:Uncharacterized protein n=1 Tax=viral metagenome TaxID=1070528 RepID=A0A6C0CNV3_9ZZZZ
MSKLCKCKKINTKSRCKCCGKIKSKCKGKQEK